MMMQFDLREQFRSALLGLYLAEWKFGSVFAEQTSVSGPCLPRRGLGSAVLEGAVLEGMPAELLTQESAAQLVYVAPWLLRQHDDPMGCIQGLARLGLKEDTQQMAVVLACGLGHLFDQQSPQTLLAALAQKLSGPLTQPTSVQTLGQSIAALERRLQQPLPAAFGETSTLLPSSTRLPVEAVLFSFLRIPESYGLAVKYAFDCTQSSAIAALTGLLAGASGGLSQMPLPWLSAGLPVIEPTLDLANGGLAQLWPHLDTAFARWAGSPPGGLTAASLAPMLPLPSA
ncbi:MAG: hypothetical protein AAF152_07970 [Cyanobacteria bacterium P01_A01_bin.114]